MNERVLTQPPTLFKQPHTWWRVPVFNRRAWTWENKHVKGEWWQHAVFYQIFPLSFYDSGGDGIGDLDGIIQKLDYIRSLGVEALWLNPIYPSSHEDAGYDVVDLEHIDPLFGDLDIFKNLLAISHDLGLKVIIDQVWSHTSSSHKWFKESASNRHNAKASWYVWADPNENGKPPNNWLSAFTGESAWCWHDKRQQFYLANFMPSQPDLNWHNQDVIDAVLKRARSWLDLGIDGFRIDAVNFFVHDASLRDNPPRQDKDNIPDGIAPNHPMVQQKFTNSFCREETLDKLQYVRALMNDYPHTVTLGEVTLCEDSIALSGRHVGGEDRLHLAYNSALLEDEALSASMLRNIMIRTQEHFPTGGQCWIFGNHDYERLRSRWTGKDKNGKPYPLEFYKMVAALVIALPGALCLYQGDELGLPLARVPEDIPPEKLQDPFGKKLYPKLVGRDPSRTPMPWLSKEKNCGFTDSDNPWLPIPESHYALTVDIQNKDPQSLLNTWRKLLQWRAAQPALIAGDYKLLEEHEHVFAFKRNYAEQRLYCLFNISDNIQFYAIDNDLPFFEAGLFAINQEKLQTNETRLKLEPYSAIFLSVIDSDIKTN